MDNAFRFLLFVVALIPVTPMRAQQRAVISIDAKDTRSQVSKSLHGIFFEEISHAGEGGLYGELIQNRGFEDCRIPQGTSLRDGFIIPRRTAHFMLPGHKASDWKMEWPLAQNAYPAWSLLSSNAVAGCSLSTVLPLNNATPHSMEVSITSVERNGRVRLQNEGFWGINVVRGDEYLLTLYLRSDNSYSGTVTASLRSHDGVKTSSVEIPYKNGKEWRQYQVKLTPSFTDAKATFNLAFNKPGKIYVDFVSLFPKKTFKNRANGLRNDIATLIDSLHPSFVRWPGGCFVEGINIESAPDWKRTIGPIQERPGTFSPWGYWTSDGLGFYEYLQFCEDINADALYVFNAGISCEYRSGTYAPDDSLQPYIQNALDAIEYAIGPVTSYWGSLRAAHGHPAPFPLKYVEVGNEQHGPGYARRYNVFYAAIKKKYPAIKVIASMGIGDVNKNTTLEMKSIEIVDEHAYKSAYWAMNHFDHFEKYPRGHWDMYVGEYATNAGVGNGNIIAALSDATYIMSMEQNADLVKMSSYAPLLVNENDVDWPVNLIHFNASQSFARISYYVIKMMNENKPDVNISTSVKIIPSTEKKPLFSGGIGLADWDTQTEYKDVEVLHNGYPIYKSDFIKRPEDWVGLRGDWHVTENGGFAQKGEGAQLLALLKDKSFETYTLKVKARKLSGYNAFIIPFAVKDTNNFMRVHIGSYWNQNVVYEKVTHGYDVSDISSQQKLPAPIVTGRWYDVRVEVGMDTVKTFLDDTLLSTLVMPSTFFSIAGEDLKSGDIILKVVNAGGSLVRAEIDIANADKLRPSASVTTIQSSDQNAENSFENPFKIVPTEGIIYNVSSNFENIFPPYSVSVIRLKTR